MHTYLQVIFTAGREVLAAWPLLTGGVEDGLEVQPACVSPLTLSASLWLAGQRAVALGLTQNPPGFLDRRIPFSCTP